MVAPSSSAPWFTSPRPTPKLTIGMAVYDDTEGLWATCQALRLYHDMRQVEVIVVDNNPNSDHGKETKKYVENWVGPWTAGARYIAMPENTGTTQPRNRIFDEARGDAVMVMDSHVFLAPGAISRLIRYFDENPDTGDLLSGPMLYDDLRNYASQFDDVWGSDAMWGTWGRDQRLDDPQAVPFEPFPDGVEPVEIFAMGLGLFACRRDKWLGFNRDFRGFGGEECYIHEKFRAAGRKCLCLPWLRWNHRFIRVGGAKYPRLMYWKARNYVLGFLELGKSLAPVHAAFVASGKLPPFAWEHLVADPVKNIDPPNVHAGVAKSATVVAAASDKTWKPTSRNGLPLPPADLTLDDVFSWCRVVPRDWNEHLDKLRELASKCEHVTEMTKRRESTVGLAAGRPKKLVSYQRENDDLGEILHYIIGRDKPSPLESFTTHAGDFLSVDEIEETDMLLIDSIHSADRLHAELKRHGHKVRRWLVIRGTESFGEMAEGSTEPNSGLYAGLDRYFLEHPEHGWHRVYHASNQYGLSVYSRDPAEPEIDHGPGTELSRMLRKYEINPAAGCDCKAKARKMDEWGVEGCRKNMETIVGWMREGVGRWGWADRLKAAAAAVMDGTAFKLNPLDPFPGLIEEAIRRAEAKEKATAAAVEAQQRSQMMESIEAGVAAKLKLGKYTATP